MTTKGHVYFHIDTARATAADGRVPLTKVTRHDRKRMNVGRDYGRMCDECFHDLLGPQVAQSEREKAGKRRSVQEPSRSLS